MEQMMKCLLSEIRANLEKSEALQNKMWTNQKEVKAMMETGLKKREAIPKEVEDIAERQEVPNGVTCKKTIGAMED
jgi:hypothetical protein